MILLALVGGSQLELTVAALAFLRTVWVHKGSHSPRAGDAAADVYDGSRRPKFPQVRGRDLRPSSISPATNLRARHLRPKRVSSAADRSDCQKYFELIMEHTHVKQWAKALAVLTEMRQLSIEPDVLCFTALINVCDKAKQPEEALELFDTMQVEGVEPDWWRTTRSSAHAAMRRCRREPWRSTRRCRREA
jgi:pentatricopeptide repeat protein